MHISNNKYRLAQLNRQNIQKASTLLGKMFYNYNEIQNTFGPNETNLIVFMKKCIDNVLDQQTKLKAEKILAQQQYINMIYINSHDKIVGVVTNYELLNYIEFKNSQKLNSNVTQTYSEQFFKSIKPQDKVKGKTIYGEFICIDNAENGLLNLFCYDLYYYLDKIGFKIFVTRITNAKTLKWFLTYGASILTQINLKENGKEATLYYIRFQIQNFIQSKDRVAHSLSKL